MYIFFIKGAFSPDMNSVLAKEGGGSVIGKLGISDGKSKIGNWRVELSCKHDLCIAMSG